MTVDSNPEKKFVSTFLPWLIAAGALCVYLATLNPWVSFGNLRAVARLSGWLWQPELYSPLYWLVTLPLQWLPPRLIPLALNLFSCLCAVASLGLLARSVLLLPQDRTQEQRRRVGEDYEESGSDACIARKHSQCCSRLGEVAAGQLADS